MVKDAAADTRRLEVLLEEARELVREYEITLAAQREQEERLRKLSTNAVLTKSEKLSRLDSNQMDPAHRLAISRGRSSSKVDPKFKAAYRSKGYTLTSLAGAVDCDAPLLSKYRRQLRRIPQDRAEKIARLIPWPADQAHWPGGIVPKD